MAGVLAREWGRRVMAGDATQPEILAASRVSKSFGEVPVLFSVDFDVHRYAGCYFVSF